MTSKHWAENEEAGKHGEIKSNDGRGGGGQPRKQVAKPKKVITHRGVKLRYHCNS